MIKRLNKLLFIYIYIMDDIIFNDNNIEKLNQTDAIDIELEKRGSKKSNTYIKNWNLSKDELKIHLKTIKQTYGCNGSIKRVSDEKKNNKYILQLQGDKREVVKQYLIKLDVSEDNIIVHGYT